MAKGEPNDHGLPDRSPPDDSLWVEETALGPSKTPARPAGGPDPGRSAGSQRHGGGRESKAAQAGRWPGGPEAPAPGYARSAPKKTLVPSQTVSALGNPPADDSSFNILLGLAQNAPAWLISAVVHTSLLIVLGLFLVALPPRQLVPPGIELAEQLGDSLDDTPLADGGPKGSQLLEKNDSQILAPQNLPQVADPFAAPQAATDIRLGGILPSSDLKAPTIGLALHGREAGIKGVLLGAYGGTGGTESAVGRGLDWLVKQQRGDGLWSLTGPYASHAQEENTAAATAMALLAFQGAGITPTKGIHSKTVDKGWAALLKLQQRSGSFGVNIPNHQQLYTHAQCTIALCEVLSMTQDSRFYEPAQRAVAFCLASQDKKGGGWRYDPGTDSDTSVTGWFVMALKSAAMAKLEVPQSVFDEVTRYLDSVENQTTGTYAYTTGSFSTPAVTAEAYLCRQLLGWKHDDPKLIRGCDAITANLVKYDGPDHDAYYWYYATQVCHNMEGPIWETWNTTMRKELPEHQVKSGAEMGSWDPNGDRWQVAGRLYTTCLSIYMLEVYYRHLPIYSAYKYAE